MPAPEDKSNWDIKANQDDVRERIETKINNNLTKMKKGMTKTLATMFNRTNSNLSKQSTAKKSDVGVEDVLA